MLTETLADCPECRSAGSVRRDRCENCDARVVPQRPMLHPAVPLRFSHVMDELRSIAALTQEDGDQEVVLDDRS